MSHYRPQLDPGLWAQIQPFVDSAVADSEAATSYNDRELYAVVTPLAAWMVTHAGQPLRRDIAFDPCIIDRFVMEGLAHYTKAGRGTMRSRLRRVSEALLSDSRVTAHERPLGKSEPCKPYSQREIATLEAWARALPDSPRPPAQRLLALGFGAGLIGSEIGGVHVRDLHIGSEGVSVNVDGNRKRTVPVLHSWEKALLAVPGSAPPDSWVFRFGRQTVHRNVVTNFVEKHVPPVPLQARRMRATWIVAHLNAGTPVRQLLTISGLSSAEALDPFLPFTASSLDYALLRRPTL